MATFGERLKALREHRNLSQDALGKVLHLSQSVIAHYEADRKQPSNDTLKDIADVFNVTTDYLLGRSNNPLPPDWDYADPLQPTDPGEHRTFYRKYGLLPPEAKKIIEQQTDELLLLEMEEVLRLRSERDKGNGKNK